MLYENEKAKKISFPLGGIGTGSIGLSGRGELKDFEIFNRPSKGSYHGNTFFALKVSENGKSQVKILHGDTTADYVGDYSDAMYNGIGFGPSGSTMAGLPHFKNTSFEGRFPIAGIDYNDEDFPVKARLTAFNPFIPQDSLSSSLPAAFFEWELTNISDNDLDIALCFSAGSISKNSFNRRAEGDGFSGLEFTEAVLGADNPAYAESALLTDHPDTRVQEFWYRGRWMDGRTTFWNNFTSLERLPERRYDTYGEGDHGSVVAYARLPRGKSEKIRFVFAWYVPTVLNYWEEEERHGKGAMWRNYYATVFKSALDVAEYSIKNFSDLLSRTACFTDILHGAPVPSFVTDAVSSNLSVLNSPTVLRLPDGKLWGWEGVMATRGSCPGSCQHVWNYAYALPFLFGDLERSLRENTLENGMEESGRSIFRVRAPGATALSDFRACVDGQMGEVIKFYREWKLSGDGEWLKKYADRVFKLLEYAWSEDNPDAWDRDMDGVMEGRQHHTLDMELFGPSSWLQGFYLLALRLGAEMAHELGLYEKEEQYLDIYKKGRVFTNERLFNGRYFHQRVDLADKSVIDRFGADEYWNYESGQIKWQLGEGCIIDQLLADYHATLIGVEGVFDEDKKRTALDSLYKYNFKPSMRDVVNLWRIFALNDEGATVICSYPDGAEIPDIPIPYCDEAMTGFEYALAVLMIANGRLEQGETIVKAIRDRYDGEKRNPYNEIECGSNYARSMASFGLLNAYSGFKYDMTRTYLGFAPLYDGSYYFGACDSWGSYTREGGEHRLAVLGKPIELSSFGITGAESVGSLYIDGESVDFTVFGGELRFEARRVVNSLVAKKG